MIHTCWTTYQYFIPFDDWKIVYCIDMPHLIYPFIRWRMSGLFPFFELWIIMLWIFAYKFVWVSVFNSLGMYWDYLWYVYGNWCFTFWEMTKLVSIANEPFSLHPHQHYLLAILLVKWLSHCDSDLHFSND